MFSVQTSKLWTPLVYLNNSYIHLCYSLGKSNKCCQFEKVSIIILLYQMLRESVRTTQKKQMHLDFRLCMWNEQIVLMTAQKKHVFYFVHVHIYSN